jgi:hypothetical protein
MRTRGRLELDTLMRDLMVLGFLALACWSVTAAAGLVSETITISARPTLRFLLAVLVLVFSRRTYWEFREWRWRRLPPDDRYGFSSPLWEHQEPSETTPGSSS